MKLKLLSQVAGMSLAIFIASCSSKKSDVPVPDDAGFVLHIDGKSLGSKLSWDEIKQSDWYRIAQEKAKDSLAKQVLSDPDVSGVDINSDMYMFMKVRGRGGYLAFIGNLKDEKAFASFVEKTMKDKRAAKEGNLMVVRSNNTVLTWKEKRFVMVADNPSVNTEQNPFSKGSNDAAEKAFPADSLVKFANEVYDMKGSKSLGNNSKFAGVLKEKGDMHFWLNSSNMYSGAMPSMLALTKIGGLLKDNYSTGTLSFEEGKIAIQSKNYYNKEITALFKKHKAKDIDPAVLRKIPMGQVSGVIAFNFNPDGLREFLTLLGVDGIANMMLADMGMNVDEIIRATKGEFVWAMSDFTVGPQPLMIDSVPMPNMTETKPKAKMIFAGSLNDPAAFNKLLTVLREKMSKAIPGGSAELDKTPFVVRNNWFIAGSDQGYINSFDSSTTEHPFISKFTGHSMAGYFDIQRIIQGSKPAMAKDSSAMVLADESLKIWQDALFYGDQLEGDVSKSYFEINMVDKKTNALKQLNSYFGVIARLMDEKDKRKDAIMPPDGVKIDTAVVVPAPQTPR